MGTLSRVEDPEIPAVSIVDLGLIRYVKETPDGSLEVGLSPTYVGCPASEVIRRTVREALAELGIGDFTVINVLSPAWSSDWITPEAAASSMTMASRPRCRAHFSPWPARIAARSTRRPSANSALRLVRRCIAAVPALNRSNTSSAFDMAVLSFHPLKVAAVERAADDATCVTVEGTARLA